MGEWISGYLSSHNCLLDCAGNCGSDSLLGFHVLAAYFDATVLRDSGVDRALHAKLGEGVLFVVLAGVTCTRAVITPDLAVVRWTARF